MNELRRKGYLCGIKQKKPTHMQLRNATWATLLACTLQLNAQQLAPAVKGVNDGNPISPCVFCADPTALEYDGRLYVYGTNDHQQYISNQKTGGNGYGGIKSLVVFSTDDLANWTFHGTIDVGKVCGSWCGQSWAPSAVWRLNSAGKPEFFIYFANGGGSVGVIRGTSPVGPFKSPLGNALIRHGMPGVDPCNWVFDPGVVIDENGTGWIAFGGGDPQSTGSDMWPGNSRIAKLKPSMTALDGSAVNLPAPYLFEASELNMMNGRYVYTYNTSWSGRSEWNSWSKRGNNPAPSSCSMCYMVTDNPLDPDSWEYRGEYVPNEGNFGMGWGNNHTHLQKYGNSYFLFYHSTLLEQNMKAAGEMDNNASGYRSIGVNKATVNERTQAISKMTLNKTGVSAVQNLDPYIEQQAETMATSGGVSYEDFSNTTKVPSISTLGNDASKNLQVRLSEGAWTQLRKVAFGTRGASELTVRAKGTGTIQVRLNGLTAKPSATVEIASTTFKEYAVPVDPSAFKGTRTIFFVCAAGTDVQFDSWQFTEHVPDGIRGVPRSAEADAQPARRYDLSGRRLTATQPSNGIVVEQYTDADGTTRSRKRATGR